MKAHIPTNIITGFLGVGKTTAILHLLKCKPPEEKWSVLVNEFGEIGIDGALLKDSNAYVREVSGGCICCVADLPMKMALNMLIAKTNPHRIIIEPTGLGHPEEIIKTLTGDYYCDLLDLRATLTLVDPRKLRDARYTENKNFQDQLMAADVLVANKMDVCAALDEQAFDALKAQFQPPKSAVYKVTQGEIQTAWLDIPRSEHTFAYPDNHSAGKSSSPTNSLNPTRTLYNTKVALPDGKDYVRRENKNEDAYSCGWLFAPHLQFQFNALFGLLSGVDCWRAKAVMNTTEGVYMFNAENGVLSVNQLDIKTEDIADSRIEFIDDKPIPADVLETELMAMRCDQ